MTELGCKVKNCLHHSTDNLCCRDTIKVDGCNAKDCCSTCCASYEKQAGLKPKTKQWRDMFHLMYAVKQQIVNITKTIIVLQSTLMLNRLRIKILVVQNVQVLN